MKKFIIAFIIGLLSSNLYSQPWLPGGQFVQLNQGQIGSQNNEPLQVITSNTERIRVNDQTETLTHVAWGVQDKPGFVGIGTPGIGNPVPYSLLHLYGPNPTNFQAGGWRPWMRSGAFITENSDNLYVGMKPEPGELRGICVQKENAQ
jgi:hypothetical protein